MSYVEKNLMSGESVIETAKLHWFIFVPGVSLLAVGVWLFGLVTSTGDTTIGPIFGTIAVSLAIISLIKAYILKISTELAVTSKRIIAKVGLIRRNTVELNHAKVESFNIDQSIFGRIFGFGTLIVNGTGGGKTPIPSIAAPLDFRRSAMETIDSSQG
ncbi:MAG: PH domain-containing protein [Gammaproteobacteria bacterium]